MRGNDSLTEWLENERPKIVAAAEEIFGLLAERDPGLAEYRRVELAVLEDIMSPTKSRAAKELDKGSNALLPDRQHRRFKVQKRVE